MKNEVADNKKGMSDFYVVFFFLGGGTDVYKEGFSTFYPLTWNNAFRKRNSGAIYYYFFFFLLWKVESCIL